MWDEARSRELNVFIPTEKVLTVDLDEGRVLNEKALEILRRYIVIPPRCIFETTSQNGGKHVYLKLEDDYELKDRILMQLALGSDPVRETLAFTRTLYTTNRTPLTLFETDEWAPRVEEFLEQKREKIPPPPPPEDK